MPVASSSPGRSALASPAVREPAEPRIVTRLRSDPSAQRRALAAGLRSAAASIAPKYFYDALGAALYSAICELPEYYLTRTEREIFTRHRSAIAAAIGPGTQFVDLGAADGAKAADWLPFLAPLRYLAVDFAADILRTTLARLAADFPHIEMLGVVTDFTQGLDLRRELAPGPVTYFYPGSSIGNFTPDEARSFLADIRRHCITAAGSGLLIGVDTRKDPARLEAAYDDRLGITTAFNRNILLHVNRVLGCDFDPAAFAHVARYDADRGRIEMHLEAMREVTVHIDAVPRHFRAGERIHTENSYKYAPAQFTAMLQAAGFESVRVWQDDADDFGVYYAV
jgi:dimethylhistidine N-methyltransferase